LTAEISTVKYSSYENMEDSPTDVTWQKYEYYDEGKI
jgi:hypothetical protein